MSRLERNQHSITLGSSNAAKRAASDQATSEVHVTSGFTSSLRFPYLPFPAVRIANETIPFARATSRSLMHVIVASAEQAADTR